MTYPLHLDLAGRRVLVVGAGTVASRRVDGLLAAGADVVVVAPVATARIAALADDGSIAWRQRPFALSDVVGAWLAVAATDDRAVNARVAEEASRRRIWSVRADDAQASAARTPAVATVDGVTVSVGSGDPRRSAAVRDSIRERLMTLPVPRRTRRRKGAGSVVLVGGGPGDPGLITVRGRSALLAADVVVHDRLGPVGLLDELSPDVEVIDAGKGPGRQAMTQEQINELIVRHARAGRRVARLKGGDPFVLGRGAEEVLACREAGVPVEVIPGLSSALAGPAAAGIPVTHRGMSTGFVVISGHDIGDLAAVAGSGLTVVVLMGIATLPRLVEEFTRAGRRPGTPVAVVHRATERQQRVVHGTLADIAARVAASGVSNPSVIVIGDVVGVMPQVADIRVAS
ncbi:MAG: uroporphyrinogen-III C-methyltransferase [Candidatus Nanopelagicales bacterium]